MKKVVICDDQQRFIDEFKRRHKDHFAIESLLGSEGLIDLIRSSETLPDVVVLDLYFPNDDTSQDFSEKVAIAEAELKKLDAQIAATRHAVLAAWSPDGLHLLQEIRANWDASKLPVVIFTQKGLLLLDDDQIRAVEQLNGHWMLKGQLSRETERIRLNRIMSYDAPATGRKVFIGHGRKDEWRKLQAYLEDELSLECTEFNSRPAAGVSTFERLWEIVEETRFAFLVMTGEDEDGTGTLHARENVIHEIGLFQARLGPRNAIVLLEEGCQQFSNIKGLGQIQFPRGDIAAAFPEIQRTLRSRLIVAD